MTDEQLADWRARALRVEEDVSRAIVGQQSAQGAGQATGGVAATACGATAQQRIQPTHAGQGAEALKPAGAAGLLLLLSAAKYLAQNRIQQSHRDSP